MAYLNNLKNFITKSIVIIAFGFLVIVWFMLQDTNLAHEQIVFHVRNGLPIIAFGMIVLFAFTMKKLHSDQIERAKLEQKNEDYNLLVKYLKMKVQDLSEKQELTEEKTNNLISKIRYLSQLTEVSDLALYLMEKTLNITEEFQTDLNLQIEGNISSLKRINAEDLKQTIELILAPICNNFDNIQTENRRDINLFIRESDNKIIFKVMHDYISDPISTETIEWNVKKILHKYGGQFTVANELEEESDGMFVLSLTMDIPKEIRARKVI